MAASTLIVTPSSPRIVSEVHKVSPSIRNSYRNAATKYFFSTPRVSGELLVYLPVNEEYDETKLVHGLWSRKTLIIRSGCLEIANEPNNYRIPLRQLHLVASPSRKYAIVLKQFDSSISIVIQAADKKQFEIWIKVIAIELIRQTPLSRIKYFDILTYEPLIATNIQTTPTKAPIILQKPAEPIANTRFEHSPPPTTTSATHFHEKILFFESLSRLGRLIHSSEDITMNNEPVRSRNSSCCLPHDSAWSSGSGSSTTTTTCNSLNTSFECSTLFTNSDIDSDIDTNFKMDANIELVRSPNVREMCLFFEQSPSNHHLCNNNSNRQFVQIRRDFNNNKI